MNRPPIRLNEDEPVVIERSAQASWSVVKIRFHRDRSRWVYRVISEITGSDEGAQIQDYPTFLEARDHCKRAAEIARGSGF